jgi:hypothetical protein
MTGATHPVAGAAIASAPRAGVYVGLPPPIRPCIGRWVAAEHAFTACLQQAGRETQSAARPANRPGYGRCKGGDASHSSLAREPRARQRIALGDRPAPHHAARLVPIFRFHRGNLGPKAATPPCPYGSAAPQRFSGQRSMPSIDRATPRRGSCLTEGAKSECPAVRPFPLRTSSPTQVVSAGSTKLKARGPGCIRRVLLAALRPHRPD